MKYGNEVKELRPVGNYCLRIVFKDGYVGEVDLWPLFANPRGPMTEPFQDPAFFQKVMVDPELSVATWPNGYDICSDVLRYYCEIGRVCSCEELGTAFDSKLKPSETSALFLNDKKTP